MTDKIKQVIIIRRDLKMRRGKEMITALAIGPNRSSEIDPITAHLKVY